MWNDDLESRAQQAIRGLLGRDPISTEVLLSRLGESLETDEVSPRLLAAALKRVRGATQIEGGWVSLSALFGEITLTTRVDPQMVKRRRASDDSLIDLDVIHSVGPVSATINDVPFRKSGFEVFAHSKYWLEDVEAGDFVGFTFDDAGRLDIDSPVLTPPDLHSAPYSAFKSMTEAISEETGPGLLSQIILTMAEDRSLHCVWPPITSMLDEAGMVYDFDQVWPESMDRDAWMAEQALEAADVNDGESEDEETEDWDSERGDPDEELGPDDE